VVKIRPRNPLAIRLALTKLLPQIEPLLAKHELSWAVALPALEKAAGSVAEVEAASQDPAAFVEKVLVAARDPDLAAHFIGLPKMTRTRQVRGSALIVFSATIQPPCILLKVPETEWDPQRTRPSLASRR
jgi:hypothetical protein